MDNAEEPQARRDDGGSGGADGAAGAEFGGPPPDAASVVVADAGYRGEAQGGEEPDEAETTDLTQAEVINDEDDCIIIGGGSCKASTEPMDNEWTMVMRPDGTRF